MSLPRACCINGVITRSVSKANEPASELGPQAKAITAKDRSGETRR